MNYIKVRGAREHNLKNINIDIPKNKLVVITGLSGSGKSTLAFDTLYAEGQRRYVDSLSSYARQFLDIMPKPDVDSIEGLSPAISIEQKTISKNPRSTVGTVTEITDYMRLLFARVGIPYSPATGLPIKAQTVEQIVDTILAFPDKTKLHILSPVVRHRKGELKNEILSATCRGFERAFIDGALYDLDAAPQLSKTAYHDFYVVVDRIVISHNTEDRHDLQNRLANSVEIALKYSDGLVMTKDADSGQEHVYSENFACPVSGFCIPEIEPRLFSFNSPKGMCQKCLGLGFFTNTTHAITEDEKCGVESDTFTERTVCTECNGTRLCKEALAVKIDGLNIAEVSNFSISEAAVWFKELWNKFNNKEQSIADKVIKEISNRLSFLIDVGLDYLTLSRASETLSGGEAQRIKLASQIGSGLTGVIYVLDEPSIGLHQRDNDRLIHTLKSLKECGNTVIVVEHDEDTMYAADWIVDIGPRAGVHGGCVVAEGVIDQIKQNEKSLTGLYLSGKLNIALPKRRRDTKLRKCIEVIGASGNNLKNINVKIPIGAFTCVTGVSGSGKSSLVIDTLFKYAYNKLAARVARQVADVKEIKGLQYIDKVVNISQTPIGRTPRSNPATYVGCFTEIRDLFASMPDAKARGYTNSRFSFNTKGGRCEACKGDGVIKIEMNFLPDVYVQCDQCMGRRYNRETLEIKFKDKSIADILDMTIEEGAELFKNQQQIYQKLDCLCRVGLGYLTIGHKATILSGGEAQRVKLARELSKKSTGNTLYILDEPTTGLHIDDIKKLTEILNILVDYGNTVVVIEHNMDIIKIADWIIDIGREGGVEGGNVVCVGTPEDVANCESSYTGKYLKKYLK